MRPTTTGRFRVHADRDDEWVLVDEEYDPTRVRKDGEDLRPGYRIEATVAWDDDDEARIDDHAVEKRSRFRFAPAATGLFEAARDAWATAEAAGDAMNVRVTRNTDREENGVCYVFAGGRDRFAEFRDGRRPIEPLVERVNEARGDDERAVFVLNAADEPFVVVYVVLRKDGLLAETMEDTYEFRDG